MKRCAIIIEKADGNYSAYAPDLSGCVATGDTVADTIREMREAIEFHLEGMRLAGEVIPEPTGAVEYVEIEASAGAP
jgi:predicted RNase H-like HicB family nuclease